MFRYFLILALLPVAAFADDFSYSIFQYRCEKNENHVACKFAQLSSGKIRFNSSEPIQTFEKKFSIANGSENILSITHYNTPEIKTSRAVDITISSKHKNQWIYTSGLASFNHTSLVRQQGMPYFVNAKLWIYPVVEVRPMNEL